MPREPTSTKGLTMKEDERALLFYLLITEVVYAPTEVSLIVPDLSTSVYSSSCRSKFFYIILSFILSLLFLGIPSCLWDANKEKEKEKERY